jgi:hypothetical protein
VETELRDKFKEILSEFFEERDSEGTIARGAHAVHHEWVQVQIEREKRRTAFWYAFAAKSVPSALWMLCVAGFGWVAKYLTEHWK